MILRDRTALRRTQSCPRVAVRCSRVRADVMGRGANGCQRRVSRWLLTVFVFIVLCVRDTACQRLLLDTYDGIFMDDLDVGGACKNGCTREVVGAVAAVTGETDCELRVQNLLDHTQQDVQGGTLNVVHSCIDENQNLQYQVRVCGYVSCMPV